jgi:acetyl esterase/lipase
MPSSVARRALRNLYVALIALCLTGCTRFQLLDAVVPPLGYARTRDVAYGPDPRQRLDVYRPSDPDREPATVVVFFYGGSWQAGFKADYRFVAQALTSRGFVCVLPDYRIYPQVKFPAFVEDGAQAVRWTRDHVAEHGGDPRRIFLMGHSAGAHIAALLTLDRHYLADAGLPPDAIRGTAALSGTYDFQPGPGTCAVFDMPSPDAKPDPRIEPVTFATGRAPPMLLIHGLQDDVVKPSNTSSLASRLRAAGSDVRVITYPSRGHVGVALALAWPFRWLAPVLDDVTRFVHEH